MLFNDKLYYKYEKNNNSDTIVVLLHGLTMSSQMEPINSLYNMLKEKYSVLTFDFIGHGKSYGNSLDITIEKEVIDAKEIIDHFIKGYKNIILIGHSLGGLIASILAKIYKPLKLIMLAPAFCIYEDLCNSLFFGKKIRENKVLQIWNMKFSYEFFLDAKNKTYFEIYPFNAIIIHGTKDKIVPISTIMPYKDILNVILLDSDHEFTDKINELCVTISTIL